jgi:hypothetical protein
MIGRGTDTRAIRAIASVECPRCHATAGRPCFFRGEPTPTRLGRTFCHDQRLRAFGILPPVVP